jgi:hypothetical protein
MGYGDIYGLTEKKCPICGKMFIPAPMHVYKRYYKNGRAKWLCSYHCLLEWDRAHPHNYNTIK